MLCCGALFFFCMLASDLGFEEDGRMLMMMMMGLVAHLRAWVLQYVFPVHWSHFLKWTIAFLTLYGHWNQCSTDTSTWLILLMASARFQSIKSPYVTINHERESKLDNKIPLQMERRILRGMKLANILSYQMFSSNDSILSMLCHYLGQFQEILDIVLYPLLGWQIVVI